MTGRELVLFILANHLEDEPIFKDGRFTCFLTDTEYAAAYNVGIATIHANIMKGTLQAVKVGNTIYILSCLDALLGTMGGDNAQIK